MKKLAITALLAGVGLGAFWLQETKPAARQPDTLMPAGAIFYLEAKDFHQVLAQWNGSEERKRWLKSDDAKVLGESRLLQRLMQAQTQYESVAGVPVAMSLVNELAGQQSALGFYEFSNVQFVYVTKLEGGRLDQSALWKSRSKYQTREAAGIPFYVKTESDGHQTSTVAFASHDGWLVVATEPALMAKTLALLAGQAAQTLAGESWYEDVVKQAHEQGDVRFVYNLSALRTSPQFRTYWVQQNVSEQAAYTAGVADVFEQANGFEERRALLRPAEAEAPADDAGLTQVLAHVPQTASLYRAWARPGKEQVEDTLQQVVLGEAVSGTSRNQLAPDVESSAAEVGSESDLETRIDAVAYQKGAANNLTALTDAVMAMEPKALLHSQTTNITGDKVFVEPASELALVCGKPDRAALEKALAASISIVKTGGLDPLRVSDEGGVLILSRLGAHGTAAAPAVMKGESYVANYEHAAEWPRYKKLFGVIDKRTGDAPAFFSGNIRSLGDSLYRLKRVSMVSQEEAALTRDTVRYEFAAPAK